MLGSLPSHLTIVLASSSPRRKEILDLAGIPFTVVPTRFDEETIRATKFSVPPETYVTNSAVLKARDVLPLLVPPSSADHTFLVIGSDTVVDLAGEIMEKPRSEGEAEEMLRSLSGNSLRVHTGVAIFLHKFRSGSPPPLSAAPKPAQAYAATTKVNFGTLSPSDISAYVASGEPMDKAGSFAIQGRGGQFVEGIEGDYYNVMGLPMNRVSRGLSELIKELI